MGRTLAQIGLQGFKPIQHTAHVGNRIDAELRLRSMCRAAECRDFVPRKPLVGDADLETRGLRDDGGVCPDALEHVLYAQARVFLVGDRSEENVAPQFSRRTSARASMQAASPAFMS